MRESSGAEGREPTPSRSTAAHCGALRRLQLRKRPPSATRPPTAGAAARHSILAPTCLTILSMAVTSLAMNRPS